MTTKQLNAGTCILQDKNQTRQKEAHRKTENSFPTHEDLSYHTRGAELTVDAKMTTEQRNQVHGYTPGANRV